MSGETPNPRGVFSQSVRPWPGLASLGRTSSAKSASGRIGFPSHVPRCCRKTP
jgi:hypothetical protein